MADVCSLCNVSLSDTSPRYEHQTIIVPCAHRIHTDCLYELQKKTSVAWYRNKGPHACPHCRKTIRATYLWNAKDPWTKEDEEGYRKEYDPRFIPISVEEIGSKARNYRREILKVIKRNAKKSEEKTLKTYKFSCDCKVTFYEHLGLNIRDIEITAFNIEDLWLKLYGYILTKSKNRYDLLEDDNIIRTVCNGSIVSVKEVAERMVSDFEVDEADYFCYNRVWIKDYDTSDDDVSDPPDKSEDEASCSN